MIEVAVSYYQLVYSTCESELSSFSVVWCKSIVNYMELYAAISLLGMVAFKQLWTVWNAWSLLGKLKDTLFFSFFRLLPI